MQKQKEQDAFTEVARNARRHVYKCPTRLYTNCDTVVVGTTLPCITHAMFFHNIMITNHKLGYVLA